MLKIATSRFQISRFFSQSWKTVNPVSFAIPKNPCRQNMSKNFCKFVFPHFAKALTGVGQARRPWDLGPHVSRTDFSSSWTRSGLDNQARGRGLMRRWYSLQSFLTHLAKSGCFYFVARIAWPLPAPIHGAVWKFLNGWISERQTFQQNKTDDWKKTRSQGILRILLH